MENVCPKQSLAPEGRAEGAVGFQTASYYEFLHGQVRHAQNQLLITSQKSGIEIAFKE